MNVCRSLTGQKKWVERRPVPVPAPPGGAAEGSCAPERACGGAGSPPRRMALVVELALQRRLATGRASVTALRTPPLSGPPPLPAVETGRAASSDRPRPFSRRTLSDHTGRATRGRPWACGAVACTATTLVAVSPQDDPSVVLAARPAQAKTTFGRVLARRMGSPPSPTSTGHRRSAGSQRSRTCSPKTRGRLPGVGAGGRAEALESTDGVLAWASLVAGA